MHVWRETVEEAIAKGREALRDCIDVFSESGRKAPNLLLRLQWRQMAMLIGTGKD